MNNETKNKHMTLDDRIEIQECLSKGMTFKAIASRIGKSPTTISREVKRNSQSHTSGYTRTNEPCASLLKFLLFAILVTREDVVLVRISVDCMLLNMLKKNMKKHFLNHEAVFLLTRTAFTKLKKLFQMLFVKVNIFIMLLNKVKKGEWNGKSPYYFLMQQFLLDYYVFLLK